MHEKSSSGIERWYEYDDKGKLIHEKIASGSEKWYEYVFEVSNGITWNTVITYERF